MEKTAYLTSLLIGACLLVASVRFLHHHHLVQRREPSAVETEAMVEPRLFCP